MDKETSILLKRRSVRQFTEKPIENEDLRYILNAAMHAPSAGNGQEWEFVIIKNKSSLSKLAEAFNVFFPLKTAATAIAVCYSLEKSPFKMKALCQADCAAATQNCLLAATERGIGSVWMAVDGISEREALLAGMLKLPPEYAAYSLIALGYAGQEPQLKESRYNAAKIHQETF